MVLQTDLYYSSGQVFYISLGSLDWFLLWIWMDGMVGCWL